MYIFLAAAAEEALPAGRELIVRDLVLLSLILAL
jgi:hypothetical protein